MSDRTLSCSSSRCRTLKEVNWKSHRTTLYDSWINWNYLNKQLHGIHSVMRWTWNTKATTTQKNLKTACSPEPLMQRYPWLSISNDPVILTTGSREDVDDFDSIEVDHHSSTRSTRNVLRFVRLQSDLLFDMSYSTKKFNPLYIWATTIRSETKRCDILQTMYKHWKCKLGAR